MSKDMKSDTILTHVILKHVKAYDLFLILL
jgi:hypothetical protein